MKFSFLLEHLNFKTENDIFNYDRECDQLQVKKVSLDSTSNETRRVLFLKDPIYFVFTIFLVAILVFGFYLNTLANNINREVSLLSLNREEIPNLKTSNNEKKTEILIRLMIMMISLFCKIIKMELSFVLDLK